MPAKIDPTDPQPSSSPRVGVNYIETATPRGNGNLQTPVVALSVSTAELTSAKKSGEAADPTEAVNESDRELHEARAKFKFFELYRYATRWDKVMLFTGCVMTATNGALFPCMALIFGDMISSFQPYDQAAVNRLALYFLGVAIALFITDYVSYLLFFTTAERQMKVLRDRGFKHMLHLDVTWYDTHDALQLSSRLTGDTVKIKDGMGQKLGDCLRYMAQFITGYVIGFVKGWDISLLMACVLPCIALSLAFLLKTLRARTEWAQQIYAEAGAIAEETLGSMRTVASNNGERRAIEKYNAKVAKAEAENIKLAKSMSVMLGVFFGSMWIMYAAGLWYGGKKVSDDKTSPAHVFSAFYGILLGSLAMAQISPNITAVTQAKGAAAGLYHILDTVSQIDASLDNGVIPDRCYGKLDVLSVSFAYPSRPDATILSDYSVTIESGQTVAFVGPSGGGKSTLVALLERFYDPLRGQILLDGRDISTLNIKWLRSQIGLVSQEPVLFSATIFDNIAFGVSNEVTRDQVIAAAKLANAHDFIMALPQGYETLVGEKGLSMSGGQKQRIAIARAIVREPKILVLDEATSALDAESERVVQAALNDLMAKTNMTTLVIAHRLSTIRHADKIVVVANGRVIEDGPHESLMQIQDGVYHNLYTIQEDTSTDEQLRVGHVASSGMDIYIRKVSSENGRKNDGTIGTSVEAAADSDKISKSYTNFSIMKVMALSRNQSKYLLAGCFGAAVVGSSMPASAFLLSGAITSMTDKYARFQETLDHGFLNKLYDEVQLYGALYIGGAGILLVATAIQQFCFKYLGEKLTSRLREMHFSALCRQNIAFFDDSRNATGALTADLATNATKVALISGDAQGRVVQAMFTFVAALIISFALGSWLLTLVMLVIFPMLILGQLVRMNQMQRSSSGGSDQLAHSGAHASQALVNIRTVASLGLETRMANMFGTLLEAPLKEGVREAHVNGLALGFSSFITFAAYALVFWYGGKLVQRDDITFNQLMRTLMAIMMSAQGIGSASSWLADADNAKRAGSAIFTLVDASVPIDSFAEAGSKLDSVRGRLEFRDILFKYPTRHEVTVLNDYNLVIEAGETVALCGPSGGGKSTIISLIERFYDPLRGDVLLDGHNIKELNLHWLRRQIGLVGQEPTLFLGTIAENIAYGLEEMPDESAIVTAAKMANAHDFITNFPDGYATQVGNKGEKLSGGQKQRIAIARAILKNPAVLLLDEATSALDSESEHVVQRALDMVIATQRRTTIIIAHRLSTIRKADKICVVSGGKIAEQGTHHELLVRNGIYSRLVATSKE